jgi:hypothetical protein
MWKADRSSLKREKSAVYLVFLYQKEKKKYGRNGTINLAGHIKASSSYPVQMRKPYYEDDFTIVHFFRWWLLLYIQRYTQSKWTANLLKISAAVKRSFGSCCSIFLTKSFAPLDIEGQGSEVKSIWPRKTASNMPSSFSGDDTKRKQVWDCDKGKETDWNSVEPKIIITGSEAKYYLPKKEVHQREGCTE